MRQRITTDRSQRAVRDLPPLDEPAFTGTLREDQSGRDRGIASSTSHDSSHTPELAGRRRLAELERLRAQAAERSEELAAATRRLAEREEALRAEAARRTAELDLVARDLAGRAVALGEREAEQEGEWAALSEARERGLELERVVAAREAALGQRQSALELEQARLASERRGAAERSSGLDERERTIELRETALGRYGEELTRAAGAASGATARDAGSSSASTRGTDRAVHGDRSPHLANGAAPQSLAALERLVRERSAQFPERAQEWGFYLFQLRSHVGESDPLPPEFRGLVEDVFAELLGD